MQCMSVSLPLLGEEEQILQHLKANERYCQIRAITSALAWNSNCKPGLADFWVSPIHQRPFWRNPAMLHMFRVAWPLWRLQSAFQRFFVGLPDCDKLGCRSNASLLPVGWQLKQVPNPSNVESPTLANLARHARRMSPAWPPTGQTARGKSELGFRIQSQLGAKRCVHAEKNHLKLGSRMALIDLGGLRTMPQLLEMQLDKGGLERQSTSSGAAKAASEFFRRGT